MLWIRFRDLAELPHLLAGGCCHRDGGVAGRVEVERGEQTRKLQPLTSDDGVCSGSWLSAIPFTSLHPTPANLPLVT